MPFARTEPGRTVPDQRRRSRLEPRSHSNVKLDDYLPYRLSVASNAVSGLIARAYQERFGLSVPQWRVMAVLAQDGAVTPAQIVARTGMDRVTVNRAANGMVKRRLADRAPSTADGRSYILALTEEGCSLHEEIAPLALAYEAALLVDLSPEHVALLKRLLLKLQTAAGQLAGGAEPPRQVRD